MAHNLSESDIDVIVNKTVDALIEKRRAEWVDPETHYRHHDWIEQRQKDEEERRAWRNKVIQSASIWAVVIVCGFVVKSFWKILLEAIKANAG